MADALLKKYSNSMFNVYSAGSNPNTEKFRETKGVHPLALETLKNKNLDIEGLASKSWDVFIKAQDDIDFAITLCSDAKDEMETETCVFFPGNAIQAHWGLFDPDKVKGDENFVKSEFVRAFNIIEKRIKAFVSLDFENLAKDKLRDEVNRIGNII
jgi:arsenate reductase